MKAVKDLCFQFDDPETGSALALLLAAAGYDVETDLHDGTIFLAVADRPAEVPLLEENSPQLSAYHVACQLQERLERQIDEAEFTASGSGYYNVA